MGVVVAPIDLRKVRVRPLGERCSLSRIDDILVAPDAPLAKGGMEMQRRVEQCALEIRQARERGASVLLMYGAHLVKNGGSLIVNRLMERGWLTHLATNGAGSIHDWEFAFQGMSTENVRENVATGTFGTWDETGRNIHLALMIGALRGEGYGRSLGRFIEEEGVAIPPAEELAETVRRDPSAAEAPAMTELLHALRAHGIHSGRHDVAHPWKHTSIFACAFRLGVPLTVHPGIGYDIISNHPMFNGAVIGRAAALDFSLVANAIEGLDGGLVLSVGSAVMAPQVFEKAISCVNNLRLQAGLSVVQNHAIYVVDLQDGGAWDWTKGEPPIDHPAYYLRFCKSFSRMGGNMQYLQGDNVAFLHHLLQHLNK